MARRTNLVGGGRAEQLSGMRNNVQRTSVGADGRVFIETDQMTGWVNPIESAIGEDDPPAERQRLSVRQLTLLGEIKDLKKEIRKKAAYPSVTVSLGQLLSNREAELLRVKSQIDEIDQQEAEARL